MYYYFHPLIQKRKLIEKCIPEPPLNTEAVSFPEPIAATTIRNAVLTDYETISTEESEGRICAGVNVPCPPAVPIAVSGEIITENCIKIFKRYGILKVNVVK